MHGPKNKICAFCWFIFCLHYWKCTVQKTKFVHFVDLFFVLIIENARSKKQNKVDS